MNEVNFIIIVPVYNAVRYLERAVSSVAGQDYDRWRLVLIDDGSVDGSSELCERLSRENDRIRVLHQENSGQLSARTNGIRYARIHLETENSFYLFLDADDAFVPGALGRIARLISDSGCDMLVFGIEKQRQDVNRTDRSMQGSFEGTAESRAELYRIVLFDYQYNSLCRKAVSAALVTDKDYADLYHLRHGEDLMQSYDYYRRCRKALFTREVFYIYYLNEASVTNNRSLEGFQYNSQVREWIWNAVVADQVWDERTLNDYAAYNCRLLRNKIMALCLTNAPIKEIAAVMEKMKEDRFYHKILSVNKDYDTVVSLFHRGRYHSLIRMVRLRSGIIRLLGK